MNNQKNSREMRARSIRRLFRHWTLVFRWKSHRQRLLHTKILQWELAICIVVFLAAFVVGGWLAHQLYIALITVWILVTGGVLFRIYELESIKRFIAKGITIEHMYTHTETSPIVEEIESEEEV